jgi:hypothetical protein
VRSLLPLLLLGCADAPDACDAMCDAGAALYGGCLEDWGVAWSAAGYADEEDWRAACDAWTWEMALLEQDAVARGRARGGELLALCAEREALWIDDGATCTDYTSVDWSEVPWETP